MKQLEAEDATDDERLSDYLRLAIVNFYMDDKLALKDTFQAMDALSLRAGFERKVEGLRCLNLLLTFYKT